MKKIINTFKYSDTKTRLVLLATLLSGLGALAALICGIVFKQMFLFFLMIVLVFVTIALAQTFMIAGELKEHPAPLPKTALFSPLKKTEKKPLLPIPSQEMGQKLPPLNTVTASEKKQKKAKKPKEARVKEKKVRLSRSERRALKEKKAVQLPVGGTAAPVEEKKLDRIKYADMKKGKRFSFKRLFKKVAVKLHISEPEPEPSVFTDVPPTAEEQAVDINIENWFRHMEGTPEVDEAGQKKARGEGTGDANPVPGAEDGTPSAETVDEDGNKRLVIVRQATEEDFEKYNRKTIKKTLHKYKVKRDHRMIMVDKCEELYIKQTPAYVWVNDKEFHLLLIEKEPRHIVLPTFRLREMTYLKKQVVNEDVDYGAFKGRNLLAEMFRPYLPDYTHSTVIDDMSAYKNLYGFGPGIFVTNRSAKQIFDLLPIEFRVDDKVTLSSKVNTFFKDAYKSNILLRDNVVDANGYADRIAKNLDNMAHSTISYNEFKETLSLMVKNKLITQEFAGYYMNVRDKAAAGK